MSDRAKIFAPFAALRGYEEAVDQQNVRRTERRELSEEERSALNAALGRIMKGDRVKVTYFLRDPGPDGSGGFAEGMYRTVEGRVRSLEPAFSRLILERPDGRPMELDFGDLADAETI